MERSVFPLTAQQKDIWYTEQMVGGAVSNICGSILYDAKVFRPDSDFLQACVRELYKVNDALRIRIHRIENGDLFQELTEETPDDVPVLFFSDRKEFQVFGEAEAKKPLCCTDVLSRIFIVNLPDSYGLLVKLHHLIGDAWTLSLLGDQMSRLLVGRKIETGSYAKHLRAVSDYENSSRFGRDLDYYAQAWRKNGNIVLHDDREPGNCRANRLSFVLEGELLETIRGSLREQGCSLLAFLLTVYSLFLSRAELDTDTFWVGTTLLNRVGFEEYHTVGMFVSTLPVSVSLDYDRTFNENLKTMVSYIFQVMRRRQCTMTGLLRAMRRDNPDLPRLFDVSVNYLNAQVEDASCGKRETHWYMNHTQADALQIQIEDRDKEGVLHIHYDFKESVFSPRQIEQMHKAVTVIMQSASENGDLPLRQIRWMDDEEESRLGRMSANCSPWPFCPVNMGSWFHNAAEADPDRVVLEAADGVFTYRQLDERSRRAAAGLLRMGIRPGDTVGLAVPRNSLLPVYILAAIKIGAVFLAIDPDYPQDRIAFMLRDCHAVRLIDGEMAEDILREMTGEFSAPVVSLENNCYCIYTSGSTGNPKGVLITQRNIVNNIFWRLHAYPERDRHIISVTGVTADTFLEDLFYALFSGNTFCLVEDRRSLQAIRRAVGERSGNDIMTTPTFFRAIMKEVPLSRFGHVTLVGENLDASLAEEILSAGVCLHNEYGPSECSVCATHAVLSGGDIHIGSPIDNAEVYILDRFLEPVPVGVRGELCIAGTPVGRGYIGRPEINRERFIPDYKGRGPLYRSGDIAFWREDGNIGLVGRIDNQVKLRGIRIELEEIEKEIGRLPGIEHTGVIVTKGSAGQQLLCAFYTGVESNVQSITAKLRKNLPDHMIPQVMIRLETMPMSQNGKVDKKKLELMEIGSYLEPSGQEEPDGPKEQILCDIAGRLLRIERFSPTMNFFHSGGDSLKAMEFAAEAEDAGIRFNLQTLYRFPTVRELTEHLGLRLPALPPLDTEGLAELNRVLSEQADAASSFGSSTMAEGDILLTGVTGYLGIHLLIEYLENSEGTIWCVIRGRNGEECAERLKEQLQYYCRGAYMDLIGKRILVLKGDLTMPRLGVTDDEYGSLLDRVGTVVHAAGNVRHYGRYEDFDAANVTSTENLIEFCRSGRSGLVYCSTTSIFMGADPAGGACTENQFYRGQVLDHVYNRSKFEAERRVFTAAGNGLPVIVVRIGNLTNRYGDMLFQRNSESNAFRNRIRAIAELKAFPASMRETEIELTPVDLAARAVRLLAEHRYVNRFVFHVCSPHRFNASDIMEAMSRNGIQIRSVDDEEFERILHTVVADSKTNPAAILLNDRGDSGKVTFEHESVSCTVTERVLNCFGFNWPGDYAGYLYKYIGRTCAESRKDEKQLSGCPLNNKSDLR